MLGKSLGRSLKTAPVLLLLTLAAAAQTIPSGTKLTVRMGSGISSGRAQSGQSFDAALARDLVVNGKTLAKAKSNLCQIQRTVARSGPTHAAAYVR